VTSEGSEYKTNQGHAHAVMHIRWVYVFSRITDRTHNCTLWNVFISNLANKTK